MLWNIYLSGEIHTDWGRQIIDACKDLQLPVEFTSAVTDHAASDGAGDMLGAEDIIHPLKEVDAAAMAWATEPQQVVELLQYVIAKN